MNYVLVHKWDECRCSRVSLLYYLQDRCFSCKHGSCILQYVASLAPPSPSCPTPLAHLPRPSTDEEYEILSELPEAEVTFYCRLCERPTMDAQWRRAVQAEVQAAFKLILMSLEKEEWFKTLLAKGTTPEVRTSERLLLVSNVLMCVHRVACLL